MTKTSIFGQSEVKQEEKKPIEFVKSQNRISYGWKEPSHKPAHWKNITLLCRKYIDNLELMWAYDENPNNGCLYVGHWNDGIVK